MARKHSKAQQAATANNTPVIVAPAPAPATPALAPTVRTLVCGYGGNQCSAISAAFVALGSTGQANAKQLANAAGVASVGRVASHMLNMVRRGYAVKTGRGLYQPTALALAMQGNRHGTVTA